MNPGSLAWRQCPLRHGRLLHTGQPPQQSSAGWLCPPGTPVSPEASSPLTGRGSSRLALLTQQLFLGPKAAVVGNYDPSFLTPSSRLQEAPNAHVPHYPEQVLSMATTQACGNARRHAPRAASSFVSVRPRQAALPRRQPARGLARPGPSSQGPRTPRSAPQREHLIALSQRRINHTFMGHFPICSPSQDA